MDLYETLFPENVGELSISCFIFTPQSTTTFGGPPEMAFRAHAAQRLTRIPARVDLRSDTAIGNGINLCTRRMANRAPRDGLLDLVNYYSPGVGSILLSQSCADWPRLEFEPNET
jgi:hypothetical protein